MGRENQPRCKAHGHEQARFSLGEGFFLLSKQRTAAVDRATGLRRAIDLSRLPTPTTLGITMHASFLREEIWHCQFNVLLLHANGLHFPLRTFIIPPKFHGLYHTNAMWQSVTVLKQVSINQISFQIAVVRWRVVESVSKRTRNGGFHRDLPLFELNYSKV
ncbi:uncharacterized protein EI90DRAFT_3012693 [Cantharellus anzutake]|uniref:uncharacterized protein n=1 Tax=Cantharellus anzutake TaxID=1750568 RepID=UPI001908F22D|nr:uncharacterized protein EI90DRAFT_3012693 [Cantharellus anzutake]KAF8339739.1 hypothetical protein EI90DRAFT_3012693 [Cantharellus anzutake]